MYVINSNDLPVALQDGPFELRMREEGDMIVNFVKMSAGADFAPAFTGLPDDRCQVPHYGMVLKGRVYTDSAEGRQEYRAGEVFYWAPGHVPGALEDSEYVDFAPKEGFLHLIEHVRKAIDGS
jgi:hypothetical protein